MTMRVTVLLTSAGGAFIADAVRGLRLDPAMRVRVVGTDARPDPAGAPLLDACYQVPLAAAQEDAFMKRLVEICVAEQVHVIIPGSDSEALALSRAAEQLAGIGVAVPESDPEVARICRDKRRLYAHLRAAGVPLADYVECDGQESFHQGLAKLGYPARKVVLKPRVGAGSRRVFTLDASQGHVEFYDRQRLCGWADAASFAAAPELVPLMREAILMEYLDNPFFDVDVLMREGHVAIVVPRMRDFRTGMGFVSIGHELSFRPDVMELAARTAEAMGFSHIGDMDIGTRSDGTLSVFDVSCRFSGSVNAAVDAGLSFPLQLVRSLLGLPLARVELEEGTRCIPLPRMTAVRPAQPGRRVVMPFDGAAARQPALQGGASHERSDDF